MPTEQDYKPKESLLVGGFCIIETTNRPKLLFGKPMLDKNYNPFGSENDIYEAWEKSGAFQPDSKTGDKAYTIVIPPPNITGNLHIGHALNNVIQDILIRYNRLCGKETLWQPGTDHASIATQMVVERRLKEAGEPSRHEMGRDKFLEKVWQWKEESGGNITHQLRRLGASCDWSRERFTMDEGLSEAVLESFVRLYEDKLIYRDKRLVNWDPVMETAISDLEVVPTEIEGHLWYFRYPMEDGKQSITVATTRPETMLGDTAVAVHPEDERYKKLIGQYAIHPLTERKLKIVGDEFADPEQGSGAVKITPAHDFNDFEVGKRHDLPMVNVMTLQATMNDNVPQAYRGLDRFKAREKVIADMQALGFFEKQEAHPHTVPYGDRGGAPIEPLLTDQWFLDAKKLAEPAIAAVKQEKIKFVPENWQRVYYEWMENIQPWCISRQLWWGHRIPAWYGEDGTIFVARNEAEAHEKARQHYGQKEVNLRQDEDVLDTWFSSALWPFSTLGWPQETAELQKHYPTDVLVTAFDIIFFWVARMIMFGLYFMKKEPFHTVYVHALVRDAKGQKMSKSKGNVIDPLDVVGEYGCDAMRFTLASLAAPGRDIKLSTDKVASSRNFMTKIWNAARFCELNECRWDKDFKPTDCAYEANHWIIYKIGGVKQRLEEAIEKYHFHQAAQELYAFVRNDFCDNYLEMIKPILNGDDAALQKETRATAAWMLKQILLLLHPFTPFITEELWEAFFAESKEDLLIGAEWPQYEGYAYSESFNQIEWALAIINQIRSARASLNIAASAHLNLVIVNLSCDETEWQERHLWLEKTRPILEKMARLENITFADDYDKQAVRMVYGNIALVIPAEGVIDIAAEKKRMQDNYAKQQAEVALFTKKLSNKKFTDKAPPEVVSEAQEKLAKAERDLQALNSLKSMLE